MSHVTSDFLSRPAAHDNKAAYQQQCSLIYFLSFPTFGAILDICIYNSEVMRWRFSPRKSKHHPARHHQPCDTRESPSTGPARLPLPFIVLEPRKEEKPPHEPSNTTTTTMSQCLQLSLSDLENTMSFTTSATAALQAITREISMKEPSQDTVMNDVPISLSFSQSREETEMQDEVEEVKDETWKQFTKVTPFLGLPPEIHLKIISLLNPIDATCLSLVSKYIYRLSPPYVNSHPLDIGSPHSTNPLPKIEGCKYCVPVLYHPAHCELHYHLRSFIPKELNYCSGKCQKFTLHEQEGYSDSKEICGECGTNYRRRYERGRRMLDQLRPGEKQLRLNKWYNSAGVN